ncbi:MAG: DNA methyltransferase [Methanoregula sp.]|nr:DNA methyltransferase [Methanoregula sp.]
MPKFVEKKFKNTLYYGDNLDVIKRYIPDESIDLIYLDPPFKSDQDYNVLFEEKDGSQSAAQLKVFEDTWHWDTAAASSFHDVVTRGGKSANTLIAFEKILGYNDMLAYLSMMAPRLDELHRVLKSTGSIYLHCDTAASHYLKILLDSIFGAENFHNEISWKRSKSTSSISKIFKRSHDSILFYTKTDRYTFNLQYKELSEASKKLYKNGSQNVPLLVSGRRGVKSGMAETGMPWRGIDPNLRGKDGMHWITSPSKLEEYDQEGLIHWPKKVGGIPRLIYDADKSSGVPISDFWEDINNINSNSHEALGYPTQKPEDLLDRIISASSNKGDVVLDPFCGCGTSISVSQKLNRKWIGIDVTHLSIALMKHRLKTAFGNKVEYQVIGEPVDLPSVKELAKLDRYQFQWWALGLVGARPIEKKKGKDKGIDGRLYFYSDGTLKGKIEQIIFSVKSGQVDVTHIRDLVGVINREKSAIGVFITLAKPTRPMKEEAASAGFYKSQELGAKKYPKIQILTIQEIFAGKRINCPPFALNEGNITLKKALKVSPVKRKVKHAKLDDF